MKSDRFFFLYQNTAELNQIKFIIKLLPQSGLQLYIFCVDTQRLNLKSISGLPIKTIMIDDVIYSKFLPEQLKKAKSLRTKLSSLNINESDTFVTQALYSLNNFILYSFFKKKKSRIISYSQNSIRFKNNKFLNFSIYQSFKHSIYTFLYSRKFIFFYNVKGTIHDFVFTRTLSDIHVDFGSSIKNEMIISSHVLKFNKMPFEAEVKRNRISNKILLLIRSQSSNEIFGISEDTYLLKIKQIIKYLESKSFFVVVKNHPVSKISLKDLMGKLELNIDNVISSNKDLESFLLANSKDFSYFLTEDSSVALTLDFLNLDYYTINELLQKGSSVYSKIFGLNILFNLNEMTIKPKKKSNYIRNKKLFNSYIQNV
jgi:hypothetical protein